jgi:hypothetical protein
MPQMNEQRVRQSIFKMNEPAHARKFLSQLNLKVVHFGDGPMDVDAMNDEDVCFMAQKAVQFALAVFRSADEVGDDEATGTTQ